MRYQIEEDMQKHIAALIPVYHPEKGNCTRIIYYGKQERLDKHMIRTVLRDMVAFYQMDIRLIRKKYGCLLGNRNCLSLPLTPSLILIPFKIRKPIGINDGAFGYISYFWIQEVDQREGQVIVKLRNGIEVPILESMKCYRQRIIDMNIIRKQFMANFLTVGEASSAWYDQTGSISTGSDTSGELVQLAANLMQLAARAVSSRS